MYGEAVGIEVDPPIEKPLTELEQVYLTPVGEREWVTIEEAAGFADVNTSSIRNWLRAGILPNTRRVGRRRLVLRADILRVTHRRYNHGISYQAVREQIASDGI